MANGSNGVMRNNRVPAWLTMILAIGGMIIGSAGGAGGALLKFSNDYVNKADFKERIEAVENRAERREQKFNSTVTHLSMRIEGLTESVNSLNVLIARLEERMERAEIEQ